HFHPELFRSEWLEEGKQLSRCLSLSGADSLERIVCFVAGQGSVREEDGLVREEAERLRAAEASVRSRAQALAQALLGAVRRGQPLTWLGDRVATPLQAAREVA